MFTVSVIMKQQHKNNRFERIITIKADVNLLETWGLRGESKRFGWGEQ